MPDKRLYALTIPSGAQSKTTGRSQTQQASQGILGSDTGAVESIATEPGERPLTVEFPDSYAAVRAAELSELARGFSQPLPYYGTTEPTPDDGYYTIKQGDVSPVDPRGSSSFQRFEGVLSKVGTAATHWRRVRAAPTQVDHPFGNTLEAPVGIPSAASKVRWYDPETNSTAEPTVQTTRTAKDGDVDILDATTSPYYSAAGDVVEAIYELNMSQEGWTDPRVWDDRGFADMTDSNGALQWQKVFAGSHRFEGNTILENGLIRLTFDEASNSLTAERWDDANSTWTSQALGTSGWELFDVDLRTIGLAQAGGVVEFRDPTQSPTAYHTLTMQLARGAADPLWSTDSPVPSGLQTLLDPIAAGHIYDAFGDVESAPQGLRAREEVR